METPCTHVVKSRPVRPERSRSARGLRTSSCTPAVAPTALPAQTSRRIVYHRLRSPRPGGHTVCVISTPRPSDPPCASDDASPHRGHSRTPSSDSLIVLTPIQKAMPVPLRAPRSPVAYEGGSPQTLPYLTSDASRAALTEAQSRVTMCTVRKRSSEGHRAARGVNGEQSTDATEPTTTTTTATVARRCAFCPLFWCAILPSLVAPHLCLDDIVELSLTCKAALRGVYLSMPMWRALARDRFGVCVANVNACFREGLRCYTRTAPCTYDSSHLLRRAAVLRPHTETREEASPVVQFAGGVETHALLLSSSHVERPHGQDVAPLTTRKDPDALRQGTLVVAADRAEPALQRLTARERTSTTSKAITRTSSGASPAMCASLWAPSAEAKTTPPSALTRSATTTNAEVPLTNSMRAPSLFAHTLCFTDDHDDYRALLWRRLTQWLYHHRVQQFLREHVDRPLQNISLSGRCMPVLGVSTTRLGSASPEMTRQALTRAIHILYQGGCANAEHADRLAALLTQRAALSLHTTASALGEVSGNQPTEAHRQALADLALAHVLCPDEASLRAHLIPLVGEMYSDRCRREPQPATDPVGSWVRGYNGAAATRTARTPLALFAYLQSCLITFEEEGSAMTTATAAAVTRHCSVLACLFVITSVFLFLHAYEELQVVATHLLVKAAKVVPHCGAACGAVARLLLQSCSDWLQAPTSTGQGGGGGSVLAGHVELATSMVPRVVQHDVDAMCERWVSQWVLKPDVTLPDMLAALRQSSALFPIAEPHANNDEDGDADEGVMEERMLSALLLSLHHRLLLLRRPSSTATAPAPAAPPDTRDSIRRPTRTPLHATGATSLPTNSQWLAWESTLRYLLLTPLERERAAALTHMAALYHRPLQSHVQQCTRFYSGSASATSTQTTSPSIAEDSPPLPLGISGALVAMRLLHAACALDRTYAPAHSTLAVLCLSMSDVSAAQHALTHYLEYWTRVPLAHQHVRRTANSRDDDDNPHTHGRNGVSGLTEDESLVYRAASRAERVPGVCYVPAVVLELHGRCEGGQAELYSCKRWASEAVRHDPRLSAPVRLRAATYMDRGLGERADSELAALVRVTLRADDVALRLRFLLDVLLREESAAAAPSTADDLTPQRRSGSVALAHASSAPAQWALVAELTGTLYGLGIVEGQLFGGTDGTPLSGPYAELIVHAQHAYRRHNRCRGVALAGHDVESDAGAACATRFLRLLLHGSQHAMFV